MDYRTQHVKITGWDSLVKKLNKYSKGVQGVAERAVIAGGMLIANEAKRRFLPPGVHSLTQPHRQTGNLARSIHSAIKSSNSKEVHGIVGTNLDYAPHVEFGHKVKYYIKEKGGKRTKAVRRTLPRPYMRWALMTQRENCMKEIVRAFKIMLAKVAKGG